jgi:hypothetical protein
MGNSVCQMKPQVFCMKAGLQHWASAGDMQARAHNGHAKPYSTEGARRLKFPLQAATCITDGRIQRRRSGGGGKERGDRPVLPAVGSSGSAQWRRPSSLCFGDPRYRRSDLAAAQRRLSRTSTFLRDRGTLFGLLAAATNRSPKRARRRVW